MANEDFTIKLDYETIDNEAKNIEEIAEELQVILQKVLQMDGELDEFWKGIGSDTFREMMRSKVDTSNQDVTEVCFGLSNLLYETTGHVKETDSSLAKVIEDVINAGLEAISNIGGN